MTVRPAKTQISMGICPVWSESSLCPQWVDKEQSFLRADSGRPDWSESSLGAQTTLLVLSRKVFETISRFNETIDAETFA